MRQYVYKQVCWFCGHNILWVQAWPSFVQFAQFLGWKPTKASLWSLPRHTLLWTIIRKICHGRHRQWCDPILSSKDWSVIYSQHWLMACWNCPVTRGFVCLFKWYLALRIVWFFCLALALLSVNFSHLIVTRTEHSWIHNTVTCFVSVGTASSLLRCPWCIHSHTPFSHFEMYLWCIKFWHV